MKKDDEEISMENLMRELKSEREYLNKIKDENVSEIRTLKLENHSLSESLKCMKRQLRETWRQNI